MFVWVGGWLGWGRSSSVRLWWPSSCPGHPAVRPGTRHRTDSPGIRPRVVHRLLQRPPPPRSTADTAGLPPLRNRRQLRPVEPLAGDYRRLRPQDLRRRHPVPAEPRDTTRDTIFAHERTHAPQSMEGQNRTGPGKESTTTKKKKREENKTE